MSNEENDKAPAGAITFGTVNQSMENRGSGAASQTMVGDAVSTSTTNGGADAWAAVTEAANECAQGEELTAALDQIEALKAASDDPEPDEGFIQSAVDSLKHLKPLGPPLKAVASLLPPPFGPLAAPVITAAFGLE